MKSKVYLFQYLVLLTGMPKDCANIIKSAAVMLVKAARNMNSGDQITVGLWTVQYKASEKKFTVTK